MKILRKAFHVYSCATLSYILLHSKIEHAANTYGIFSWQHWSVSLLVYIIGVLIISLVLLIEEVE